MISSVMKALVWKRDNHNLSLNIDNLKNHTSLENIQQLAKDSELPADVTSSLNGYLLSLPGYTTNEEIQDSATLEQHRFLSMQFTRIFSSLEKIKKETEDDHVLNQLMMLKSKELPDNIKNISTFTWHCKNKIETSDIFFSSLKKINI